MLHTNLIYASSVPCIDVTEDSELGWFDHWLGGAMETSKGVCGCHNSEAIVLSHQVVGTVLMFCTGLLPLLPDDECSYKLHRIL